MSFVPDFIDGGTNLRAKDGSPKVATEEGNSRGMLEYVYLNLL